MRRDDVVAPGCEGFPVARRGLQEWIIAPACLEADVGVEPVLPARGDDASERHGNRKVEDQQEGVVCQVSDVACVR